jgi:DNA-binding NtrC family response regulator
VRKPGQNDLPSLVQELIRTGMAGPIPADKGSYDYLVETLEKALIDYALEHCDGVLTKAAEFLGKNRNTIANKLETFRKELPQTEKMSDE